MSDTDTAASPAAASPIPPEDEPQVISDDYKSLFPPHETAKLDRLRDADLDVIAKYDKIVMEGMDSFFNNEFAHADSLFRGSYKEDPLCANAWGTLGSIRAMLSFNGTDIDFASNQLIYSAAFGNGVQPKSEGIVKGISNWWKGKTTRLTPFQIRALLVTGESELLRANVLLIQDTMTGYLKAGFALRRGYNIYDRLQKYIAEFKDDHGADENTIGGIHFGLGAIHVVTSILPPKIVAVLAALGYMHDRAVGMDHLQQCLKGRTLRSPIASLLLLAYHGILPSFAPLTMPRHIPEAEGVIQETLAVYPKSIIHLWLSGRVERLKRNTDKAIEIFITCVEHGQSLRESLPQLEHFALYDLAWSYMSKSDWLTAFHCFRRLEVESAWSKMFYTYAQAACLDMVAVDAAMQSDDALQTLLAARAPETNEELKSAASAIPFGCDADSDTARRDMFAKMSPVVRVGVCRIAARRLMQRSLGSISFKVGGKIISVEQFVKRRLKHKLNYHKTPLQLELLTNPSAFSAEEAAQMCVGDDVEFDEEMAAAQDACPLRIVTGLELAGHFNVFTQTETADCEKLLAYTVFFEKYLEKRAEGEDVAVVSLLRANLERLLGKPADAEERYLELMGAPSFEHEKWVQPYATYNRGLLQFDSGDIDGARETLTKTMSKKFGGKDYNFEMQMNFRLHLTNDMFREDAAAEKAAS